MPPPIRLDPSLPRRQQWLHDLRRWSAAGIDFIQLREKTLAAGELFALAQDATHLLATLDPAHRPRLLVNSRADLAAAARLSGVHLTGRPGELHPDQVREVFHSSGLPHCTVSLSCHALPEVTTARERGADLILFGPVFQKRLGGDKILPGVGLDLLANACRTAHPTPVLALGGIGADTVPACLASGAAGVAGIRLFADVSQPLHEKITL